MECLGCCTFGMWDVWDVKCSSCGMFVIWCVWDVRCLGCGMFEMLDVQDVGCLPGYRMLIYKMPLFYLFSRIYPIIFR